MKKHGGKRRKIRTVMYVTALVLVLATGLAVSHTGYRRLSRRLNAAGQRSLAQLDSYVSSINTDLTKGLYVNTRPMLESMANELTRDASGAKSALSALPVSDIQLDNTYKFLSQVGAFVSSLDRKLSSGGSISNDDRNQMRALIKIAELLSDRISSVIESVESGEMSLEGSASQIASGDERAASLSAELSSAEQSINEYPTLIYDGPFSDNLIEKESELLKDAREITAAEAQEKAAEFCSVPKQELVLSDETGGAIPSYVFTCENLSIAVSKRGGYIVYLLSSANAGEAKLDAAQAIENARKFLEKNGFLYMQESYYSENDGICTVNFADTQYGVTCYPDLIKVSVSLDSGNVISYDASAFLMNHTAREYNEPLVSPQEAQKRLSPLLEVMSYQRAVIPTDYNTEQDTYEFHCKSDSGQEFLVYIDTETGEEDNILILLYSDNGILTK